MQLYAVMSVVFIIGLTVGVCATIGGHLLLGRMIDHFAQRKLD